jgi:hypothetical protein
MQLHACRRPAGRSEVEDAFLVGMQVLDCSEVVGCTLVEAGLRNLPGLYLASVKRGSCVIHAVGQDFIIARGDILFFTGELSEVRAVAQKFRLRLVADAFEEDLPALLACPRGSSSEPCTPWPPQRRPSRPSVAFSAANDAAASSAVSFSQVRLLPAQPLLTSSCANSGNHACVWVADRWQELLGAV